MGSKGNYKKSVMDSLGKLLSKKKYDFIHLLPGYIIHIMDGCLQSSMHVLYNIGIHSFYIISCMLWVWAIYSI